MGKENLAQYVEQFVLHFEVAEGRYVDTDVAARALLDWVHLVRATVAEVDPTQILEIEIAGVEMGSTRFPQLLRFLEIQAQAIGEGLSEYPYLKGIAAASALTIIGAVSGSVADAILQPSEQVIRLSDEDRATLEKISQSTSVKQASRRFYKTLEQDSAITGVGVADSWDQRKPDIIIPRSEFPARSGLWDAADQVPEERKITDIWDVVLVKPALLSKPHAWTFSRDGLTFNAQMHDANFLSALKDGRVPLTLQEGVIMRVEVEYIEKQDGQIWSTDPRSRRIVKVLSPRLSP